MTIENFMNVTYWLFSYALKFDIFESKIHLNKDNNVIMQFLSKLVEPSFSVNNQKFTRDQLKDLKFFNSDVLSAFNAANEEYINYITSQHSRNNNNIHINQANNSEQAFDDFIRSSSDAKKFVYGINKMLRFKNHLTLFELHTDKKTTPHSLFFCRFPEPFFNKDLEFIEKYNIIIEKVQSEIMKLIVDTLLVKISKLETEINTFKNMHVNASVNMEDLASYVLRKEENALKNIFVAMKNRAQRCETRKFEVRFARNSRNSRNVRDDSASANETSNSLDQSSVNSSYSANSNRNVSWGQNQYRNIQDHNNRYARNRSRSRNQHRNSSRDISNRRDNSYNRSNHRDNSNDRIDRRDSSYNRSSQGESSRQRHVQSGPNNRNRSNRFVNSVLSRYSDGRR
jgi:hypothetical protein